MKTFDIDDEQRLLIVDQHELALIMDSIDTAIFISSAIRSSSLEAEAEENNTNDKDREFYRVLKIQLQSLLDTLQSAVR